MCYWWSYKPKPNTKKEKQHTAPSQKKKKKTPIPGSSRDRDNNKNNNKLPVAPPKRLRFNFLSRSSLWGLLLVLLLAICFKRRRHFFVEHTKAQSGDWEKTARQTDRSENDHPWRTTLLSKQINHRYARSRREKGAGGGGRRKAANLIQQRSLPPLGAFLRNLATL